MSAIHDASTADMSSRKRRVAKSLALNIQSDSDDVKSDADDLAAKSRSRKSRASKAKPIEGRVTDDASDREMAKPNKANRKSKKNYVHAPSTDSEYHTGASSPEQNIIKQALVADADQNNLTDDIDPEPEPEQSNANLTEDLDDDSHGLVMSSDAEQQLAHDNATSTASFKRNKSAQEEDAVVNFSLVKRGLETSGEPAQLISPGNMSGVGILPTDEPTVIKSVKFATIDLTESPQCVLSSPSSASSPTASKPLNVTFSPIQPSEELAMLKHSRTSSTPKLLMSNGSVAVSTGKKPMKRLSHHTPRSIKATNAPNAPSSSLSSKSRGTPYVHKVARPNMSNVTNTSVFSSAKKAKLLDGAKSLLPPKRVTFNTPSTNKSAVKAAVVTTTKPHTSTVKTNGVSARVVQFNGSAIEPVSASVTKRTIPNFQYIHKKMFDQMESVVDVVERQKMRSAKKENEGKRHIILCIAINMCDQFKIKFKYIFLSCPAPVKTFTNLAKTRPVVRKLDNTVDGTIGRQRCDLASAKKSVKALNNTVSTVTGPSRVKLASSKKNINGKRNYAQRYNISYHRSMSHFVFVFVYFHLVLQHPVHWWNQCQNRMY